MFLRTLLRTMLVIGLGVGLLASAAAWAVPSFAVQTGQPCAACHVGAFGPQLKQFGRDFKLFGYTASDGHRHFPPIAFTALSSFTHTDQPQAGPPAPHTAAQDNFTLDQISIYYAGRITAYAGAFAQFTYDGVGRDFTMDNTDIRAVRDSTLFDQDLVLGITANNVPGVEDLWNSTPVWGFPYSSSPVAPGAVAATLIDGGLSHNVAGIGGNMLWNNLIYLQISGFKGLGRDVRNALGVTPVAGTDSYDGLIPYWRLAIQQEFDEGGQEVELGTYGLHADVLPGGVKFAGTDGVTDTALDANYQWIADPKKVTSSVVSAHATFIHESLDLNASSMLNGTNNHDSLDTTRADVSYSYAATWTPSVQYFHTSGSNDAARWGTVNGSPNTTGMVAEIAYVPFGKPDSPISWANARLALQYTAYSKFNGLSAHASDNNTFLINLWIAFAGNP